MYRIIACDLDETLLNKHGKVSTENKKAIQAACQAGVKFVPTTGRGFKTVQQTLIELGLVDKIGEYIISFNGGAITENKGNRLIDFSGLTYSIINQLFQIGLQHDVGMHVYTLDNVYVYALDQDELNYLNTRISGFVTLTEPDISFLQNQPLAKIIYKNTNKSYLQQIEKTVTTCLGDKLSISYSSHRYIEFNQKGVDKGTALLKLARLLNINPEETIAIGDNSNDLTMIKAAGLGISVNNAIDELKAISGYVCQSDNENHAIAEAIEKFILTK